MLNKLNISLVNNKKFMMLTLTMLIFLFVGCARSFTYKTALFKAKKTLELNGFDSVTVTPIPYGCYIIKKPFFMTFTAKGNNEIPLLIGAIGCDSVTACEFRLFLDIEIENPNEELEENTDVEDSLDISY